jgi:hypothetical protein
LIWIEYRIAGKHGHIRPLLETPRADWNAVSLTGGEAAALRRYRHGPNVTLLELSKCTRTASSSQVYSYLLI